MKINVEDTKYEACLSGGGDPSSKGMQKRDETHLQH
jgi:hypothetical protein